MALFQVAFQVKKTAFLQLFFIRKKKDQRIMLFM